MLNNPTFPIMHLRYKPTDLVLVKCHNPMAKRVASECKFWYTLRGWFCLAYNNYTSKEALWGLFCLKKWVQITESIFFDEAIMLQPLFFLISGFLSSQGASPQVLSAFAGLTAVFGMGTGGSPQLSPLNYVIQASDKSDISDSHSFACRLRLLQNWFSAYRILTTA